MSSDGNVYRVERDVAALFNKSSTTRADCDKRAVELVGGEATVIPIQGVCSYNVYAGPALEYVVQFRFKSLALPEATVKLAHKVYGSMVPDVSFKGQIGEDVPGKEPLLVYVMPRMKGVNYIEFMIASPHSEEGPEARANRLTLTVDVARYVPICRDMLHELTFPASLLAPGSRLKSWSRTQSTASTNRTSGTSAHSSPPCPNDSIRQFKASSTSSQQSWLYPSS